MDLEIILNLIAFSVTLGGFIPLVVNDIKKKNIIIFTIVVFSLTISGVKYLNWRNHEQKVEDVANKIVSELKEIAPDKLSEHQIDINLSQESSDLLDDALKFAVKNDLIEYEPVKINDKWNNNHIYLGYFVKIDRK